MGTMIKALTPMILECYFNLFNIGIMKAAVLPLPVLEHATTSVPDNIYGMALR